MANVAIANTGALLGAILLAAAGAALVLALGAWAWARAAKRRRQSTTERVSMPNQADAPAENGADAPVTAPLADSEDSSASAAGLSINFVRERLWDRVIAACHRDPRVHGAANYDDELLDTLHNPLLSLAETDDSPLLPGEVGFGEVASTAELLEYWRHSRNAYLLATLDMAVHERLFHRVCFDDSLAALADADERLFRVVVRTPRRQHVLLFPANLSGVLAMVPGPPGYDDPYF